jgi:hypothetical protein
MTKNIVAGCTLVALIFMGLLPKPRKVTHARPSAERSANARTAAVPAHLPVARNDAMARYRRIVI